ncbi:MAG: ribonuclease HII [Candidatus Aenigmarchaeota archaeon]|nr:ribonuclease HII [Candidatus Aenigmarchaeota archaeon]
MQRQAGRGALIGPMVICGLVIEKKDEKKLKSIGVKDSKELSVGRRKELAKFIEKIAKTLVVLRIPACRINSYMDKKINLDKIEAMKMAEIINMIDAKIIYIDSLGNTNASKNKRFEKLISEHLTRKDVKLIVENYADETYPIVSAASIIAKVERDKAIEELKSKVKFDFGVGYSHDNRTVEFLKKVLLEYKQKPNFIRWHWDTVESVAMKLLEEGKSLQPWVKKEILDMKSEQKRIKDFFFKKLNCKEEENENN